MSITSSTEASVRTCINSSDAALRRSSSFPIPSRLLKDERRTTLKRLLSIAAAAFLVRMAVRLVRGAANFWSNGYAFYFDLSQHLTAGQGYAFSPGEPTVLRVPGYLVFLAATTFGHRAFLPVVLAQSLVGAGTVLCEPTPHLLGKRDLPGFVRTDDVTGFARHGSRMAVLARVNPNLFTLFLVQCRDICVSWSHEPSCIPRRVPGLLCSSRDSSSLFLAENVGPSKSHRQLLSNVQIGVAETELGARTPVGQ